MASQDDIAWSGNLQFGLADIDIHHEQLLRRLKIFKKNVKAGDATQAVEQLLGFLEKFMEEHFLEEEEYLASLGYPALEEHTRLHRLYQSRLEKLAVRFHAGEAVHELVDEIQRKLVDALVVHIMIEDQKAAEFALFAKKET